HTKEKVMNAMGRVVSNSLRRCDLLGRLDFQLFGIILTQSSLDEAKEICFRMEQKLKAKIKGKEMNATTINRGVVEFDPKSDKSVSDLMKRADNALKQAKV
ncbi:MAG: diguanylate cyclase, partial [Deltaproteobacteria bacterium]|nr:diguanylate cyclase [Deltaproteobacteria bacterium]